MSKAIKKVNPKQQRFIKAVLEKETIAEAAKEVGYHPVHASWLLKQEHIRKALLEEMDKQGITLSQLSKKIKEGLEAVLPRKYSPKGQLIQDNEPDYYVRSIYLDKALKILGAFAPNQEEKVQKTINITITPEVIKGLLDAEAITTAEILEVRNGREEDEKNEE